MGRFERVYIILAGAIVGVTAIVLMVNGNPPNMGFCIACFERDIVGALGLHRASIVQYIRPEIIGIVLGAVIAAVATKEFKVKGGSAPVLRFVIGMFVMIGALVFLGCPLRMSLRLGAGDMNALVGLFGFIAGIVAGVGFLKLGFNLGVARSNKKIEGWIFPAMVIVLLALAVLTPIFSPSKAVEYDGKPVKVDGKELKTTAGPIFETEAKEGSKTQPPGAMHPAIWLSLVGGLVVGIAAQRTRLCFAGGIRDLVLTKDNYLLNGFIAVIVVLAIGTLALGKFKLGFIGQPIAHTEHLWNFLGMGLVGLGSVYLGGCPLRQLILAGSGNSDSTMAVLGMLAGAAFAHNFVFAAGKLQSGVMGVPQFGKIAVLVGLGIFIIIGVFSSEFIAERLGKKSA